MRGPGLRCASAAEQNSRLAGDLREHRRAHMAFAARPARQVRGTGRSAVAWSLDPVLDARHRRPCRGTATGTRSAAARNRGRGRRSAAAPTDRRERSGRPAAAPSRAQALRRGACRRGLASSSSSLWRAASAATPNTPSSSYRRTRPRTMSSLAPSAISRSRRAAASLRDLGADELGRGGGDLANARFEQLAQSLTTLRFAAGGAEDVGEVRADARRGDREELDANRFRKLRLLDLRPELVEVEQPLGDQESRRRPAGAKRPLPRSGRRRRPGRGG